MLTRVQPPRAAADQQPAEVDAFLAMAASRLRQPAAEREGALRFGVNLGTATIVLTAIDDRGAPIYWDFVGERVVRDGVVVDFQGAVQAVAQLKRIAEAALGQPVDAAATAHPPAVAPSECRACAYVLRQAGIDCRRLVDEVSAANALLAVRDGAVVNVGGGSTGVGVFASGELRTLSDRAGGGHHLDLILAGALHIPVEDAEVRKRESSAAPGTDLLAILRPGVERIGESIRLQCGNARPGLVHLAGGALRMTGADAVIEEYLGWPVRSYPHAELITPFGIARC